MRSIKEIFMKGKTTQRECYFKFEATNEYLETKNKAQRSKTLKLEFSFLL